MQGLLGRTAGHLDLPPSPSSYQGCSYRTLTFYKLGSRNPVALFRRHGCALDLPADSNCAFCDDVSSV